MRKFILIILFCFLPFYVYGQEVIEKIEVIGNERVTKETIVYYLTSQEGDFYSKDLLRRDFRVLWATGFFSNIDIQEEDGQHGKIVKIIVEENPVVREITYKTGKKVKGHLPVKQFG